MQGNAERYVILLQYKQWVDAFWKAYENLKAAADEIPSKK